ncbi:MAG: hypothetical protein AAF791_06170 [Bacteroidota bacterium]
MATDPKSKARDAFADLPTPEKTAFVIEATFQTIGQAIRETGQHLADILTDFDPETFFRTHHEDAEAPSPASKKATAKKPAAKASGTTKTASAKKTTSRRKTTGTKKSTGKTAGRKKTDDDA